MLVIERETEFNKEICMEWGKSKVLIVILAFELHITLIWRWWNPRGFQQKGFKDQKSASLLWSSYYDVAILVSPSFTGSFFESLGLNSLNDETEQLLFVAVSSIQLNNLSEMSYFLALHHPARRVNGDPYCWILTNKAEDSEDTNYSAY
jgi:hypothetical protein